MCRNCCSNRLRLFNIGGVRKGHLAQVPGRIGHFNNCPCSRFEHRSNCNVLLAVWKPVQVVGRLYKGSKNWHRLRRLVNCVYDQVCCRLVRTEAVPTELQRQWRLLASLLPRIILDRYWNHPLDLGNRWSLCEDYDRRSSSGWHDQCGVTARIDPRSLAWLSPDLRLTINWYGVWSEYWYRWKGVIRSR